MGIEVEAFVGPIEALREWSGQLPSAAVFALTTEWGLVAATAALRNDLRRCLHLPAESGEEALYRWGRQASARGPVLYFTAFEFGDNSDEGAWVWNHGKLTFTAASLDRALAFLGMPAEAGLDRFRKTYQWHAAAVLQAYEAREGPDALLAALGDADPDVREMAAKRLARAGARGEAAVSLLAEMVRADPSYGARLNAAQALATEGPPGAEALRTLLGQVENRWGVIFALGKMGPAARVALAELAEILRSAPENERREAAETLGKLGPTAGAVPALIAALHDPGRTVRSHAAVSLGRMGPAAAAAIPDLHRLLGDSYLQARLAALVSLGEIGPPPVEEAIAALRSPAHRHLRSSVAKLLGKWGPAAQAAIPALTEALSDRERFVRTSAAAAIRQIERRGDPPL